MKNTPISVKTLRPRSSGGEAELFLNTSALVAPGTPDGVLGYMNASNVFVPIGTGSPSSLYDLEGTITSALSGFELNIVASGGTAPYTYLWSVADSQTTQTVASDPTQPSIALTGSSPASFVLFKCVITDANGNKAGIYFQNENET